MNREARLIKHDDLFPATIVSVYTDTPENEFPSGWLCVSACNGQQLYITFETAIDATDDSACLHALCRFAWNFIVGVKSAGRTL